jgi:hypothetical protein
MGWSAKGTLKEGLSIVYAAYLETLEISGCRRAEA